MEQRATKNQNVKDPERLKTLDQDSDFRCFGRLVKIKITSKRVKEWGKWNVKGRLKSS